MESKIPQADVKGGTKYKQAFPDTPMQNKLPSIDNELSFLTFFHLSLKETV